MNMEKDLSVILAAAGQSKRYADKHQKKPFARLDQKAVWLHSAERFLSRDDVGQLIIVIAGEDHEDFMSRFGANVAILGIDVVHGGAERADSIEKGLQKVSPESKFVLVHDAARPCVTREDIDAVVVAGRKHGAAILGTPVTNTLKSVVDGVVSETVSREGKWLAQTPQVFRRDWLEEGFRARSGRPPTDESELIERTGRRVHVVEGSPLNIKITRRGDLKLAAAILKALPGPRLDMPFHPFSS